ncbi:endonuclease domain-containing protein [Streptomyces sp. URMC 126]|uniref:endonuclease domain-containing protein n=1 Tax=Streptomyces sp. URMC 126 TaxID=3423401 RepID=UPI003F1D328B
MSVKKRGESRKWAGVVALAGAQGGVVALSQAERLGWSRSGLRSRLRRDGWRAVGPGVFAEPGRTPGLLERLWAHQLARPELVVSHWAAAVVHGIERRAAGPEFTGPGGRSLPGGQGTLHRLRLRPDEVTHRDGLAVTTVPRTLADLLWAGPRDDALVAVESAVGRRPDGEGGSRGPLTVLDAVRDAVRDGAGMRGWRRAQGWLALADERAGSPAETIARLRMNDAGLYPEPQAELVLPGGRRVYPDFFFRGQGLVVEIEGYAWHGDRARHQRDIARYNELVRCPEVRRVLRFTADDVFLRPVTMVRTLRRALEGAGSAESVGSGVSAGWGPAS